MARTIDLGAVSAYAIAVQHGWTGTEAEWEEAIANAAKSGVIAKESMTAAAESARQAQSSANTASTAATTAVVSKNAAAASETNAATSAREASLSAFTATTKADETLANAASAKKSKEDAATSAQNAYNYSNTAVTKATEATNAASDALASANTASSKATAAAASANTASTAAATATNKAQSATESATSASQSAATATTKAAESLTNAGLAETAKSIAVVAASNAEESAEVAQNAAKISTEGVLPYEEATDNTVIAYKLNGTSIRIPTVEGVEQALAEKASAEELSVVKSDLTLSKQAIASHETRIKTLEDEPKVPQSLIDQVSTNAAKNTEQDQRLGAIDSKIDEIELFKFPNATIIGEPLIESGNISRFSNDDYLIFPFIVDVRNKPFEINMCFTTGSNVTNQQNILDSDFGLALAIQNGRGIMALSHNGTSWDIGLATGNVTIEPNRTYYAKITWDGNVYKTALSTDGQTYTDDMTAVSSLGLFPKTMYIGGSPDLFGAGSAHPFGGTINLNKCYLSIAGLPVWSGMDDAGLSTRADVSLSNLDADGEAKFDAKADKGAFNKLWELSKDKTYGFQTDDAEAYSKEVPSSAIEGKVLSVGGKSIVWNQLCSVYTRTIESNGVQIVSNNATGIVTLNGTCSSNNYIMLEESKKAIIGHKYLSIGMVNANDGNGTRITTQWGTDVSKSDTGQGAIVEATSTNARLQLRINAGSVYNNLSFYPKLFDLTAMFGAGNEPTIEEFKSMFPEEYYPYAEPQIKSADVDSVEVEGKNLLHIPNQTLSTGNYLYNGRVKIPAGEYRIVFKRLDTALSQSYSVAFADDNGDIINSSYVTESKITLPREASKMRLYVSVPGEYVDIMLIKYRPDPVSFSPYREPISIPFPQIELNSTETVRDEVDSENRKLIQRIKKYHLDGSEPWQASATGTDTARYLIPTEGISNGASGICDKYAYVTEGVSVDSELIGFNQNRLFLRVNKSKLSDLSVDSFKAFLSSNPVDLHVELAEPIITDISDILPSFEVAEGGSITFHQSNGMNLSVPNKVQYLVSKPVVNDVMINGVSAVSDGVASIPIARQGSLGVIRRYSVEDGGVTIDSTGAIQIAKATNEQIDAHSNKYQPIVPANLEYAVKSVVDKPWPLKGTLTTENKDTGVNVDLTGCTELFITGNAISTGATNLYCNGTNQLVYNLLVNGARYFNICFANISAINGIYPVYAKYSSAATRMADNLTAYLLSSIRNVSSINEIHFSSPSAVTECNLRIYAR